MSSLHLFCPSTGNHEAAVETWRDCMSKPWPITIDDTTEGDDAGFLKKCDKFWRGTDATIIGYLHNDLFVHEYDFDRRVLAEYTKPDVAVVGFLGATMLGNEDIYKVPYSYTQLARGGVIGNLTDMEVHGARETGSREVAVIDSCAVFVRRDFLSRCGGWPLDHYPNSSHCSDLWLCCMGARLGRTVRVVGVSCTHRSGGKGDAGSRWLESHGTDIVMHRRAHELVYEDFRDVLPVRIR